MDSDKDITLNVIGIVANIIGLIYNIPMAYTPWKNRSIQNFSWSFMILRLIGILLWLAYGIIEFDIWYTVLNVISLISSLLLIMYGIFQYKGMFGFKRPTQVIPV